VRSSAIPFYIPLLYLSTLAMTSNHIGRCYDKSADAVEWELQAISDREKELRESTRHVNDEFWRLTRRKISLNDRLQQLREEEHENSR